MTVVQTVLESVCPFEQVNALIGVLEGGERGQRKIETQALNRNENRFQFWLLMEKNQNF